VLIPIAIAVASILNTFTLVWLLTYVTNVSIIVQFLIALRRLGVAIRLRAPEIFRFRDEFGRGRMSRPHSRDDDARRSLGHRLGHGLSRSGCSR